MLLKGSTTLESTWLYENLNAGKEKIFLNIISRVQISHKSLK